MLRRLAVVITVWTALVGTGCASGGSANPAPEIEVGLAEVNMCAKPLGEAYDYPGLEIRSTGDLDLIIAGLDVRGDDSCAFACFREPADGEDPSGTYPCDQEESPGTGFQMTVAPGDLRLVRLVYTAREEGVPDQAALVITSNAESTLPEGATTGKLVVPLCGVAAAPTPDAGADAGASCEPCAPPARGAAWCEAGYDS